MSQGSLIRIFLYRFRWTKRKDSVKNIYSSVYLNNRFRGRVFRLHRANRVGIGLIFGSYSLRKTVTTTTVPHFQSRATHSRATWFAPSRISPRSFKQLYSIRCPLHPSQSPPSKYTSCNLSILQHHPILGTNLPYFRETRRPSVITGWNYSPVFTERKHPSAEESRRRERERGDVVSALFFASSAFLLRESACVYARYTGGGEGRGGVKRNKKLGSSGVWKRGCYGALLGREGGG